MWKALVFTCFTLLLVGCGQADGQSASDFESQRSAEQIADDEAFNRWPATPLPSEVAINDEYRIHATFRSGDPVCVADSGGHIHGFYQSRSGLCDDPHERRGGYMIVYADYNAAFHNWEQAASIYCGGDAEPFDLGLVATGEGRLTTCRSKKRDAQFEVTAVYLTDSPEIDLGNEVTGGGPDLIYWIGLITSPETQDNDLAEYRAFVSRLSLDGGGFRIKP